MQTTVLPSRESLAGQTAPTVLPRSKEAAEAFSLLYTIIARLRAPDGCPWDREQSPASIRGNILEEAYELVEAISEGDQIHANEEIGDLFLLATMTAYMYEQESAFTVADALAGVAEKLVRRHPHVFGAEEAATASGVVELWNSIKETKEGRRKKDSLLDEVPRYLPPMERAYKLQKRTAKVGFDWTTKEEVWGKVREELREAEEEKTSGNTDHLEEEMGDLLFSVVNLARFSGIDPSVALQRTNEKFSKRFRFIEKRLKEEGLKPAAEYFSRMDSLWNEAKSQ
ncbi:MAG: tetrapyrrole methylase family protein / MazG family protein [Spirochaetes bacterium]|nr:MAG: tetrapyrrole methylase family protein / MazG family protein [Spirochaetota bacterium]